MNVLSLRDPPIHPFEATGQDFLHMVPKAGVFVVGRIHACGSTVTLRSTIRSFRGEGSQCLPEE